MANFIQGGVCAPQGFRAAGSHCGVRKNADRKDLALIVSDTPCVAAAMFTSNRVKAAPVQVGMALAKGWASGKSLRAVVANSGNANACTGQAGIDAARRMAAAAATAIGAEADQVVPSSTGVIGVPLPVQAIESGIAALAASLSADGSDSALAAIMTTDTRPKFCAVELEVGGVMVKIGAMVKGAGMIRPSLATMLCFITTDAAIAQAALDGALKRAVAKSFNMVTVDGDTSTNDTVLVMANGMAGNAPIAEASGPDWEAFSGALQEACVDLAKKIAKDGEGATKLAECSVSGAVSDEAAAVLAKAVVSSSLVKAAVFGADANWGRVLCAMGYSGAEFTPEGVDLSFSSAAGSLVVCQKGSSVPFSEEMAKKVLSEDEIRMEAKLSDGTGSAVAWGCDLTYEYVRINGDYRS